MLAFFSSAVGLGLIACKETAAPTVLEQVKVDLCDKQVVLLGETGTHGDGATEQFKADLIPRLVEDCGFNLVLFEAPFYEFAKLNKDLEEGQTIQTSDMARAIGGLWKDDHEVQNLIAFLTDRANEGMLRVAGIDDQMRSRGQTYAFSQMPGDVVRGLDPLKAEKCRNLLNRAMNGRFSDDDPYTLQKNESLQDCFSTPSENVFVDGLRMNIKHYFARDFDRSNYFAGRANSMFANFEYWYDGHETPPKTIIWTATVHAAKARGRLSGPPNTGTYIHQRFGDKAFVLGFSALGGQYRELRDEIFNVPVAPNESIEFEVMTQTEEHMVFLSHTDLKAFGPVPASIYSYEHATDHWPDILDGLVIFRDQRPTTIEEPP